ncbi:hypothetical protein LTR91_001557 [Friedmanniomyces endolithicus]|uniref:Uncharacterized protein n=1 Tax=Friedmanniomyces endolithicus TaxID=329885 RepID=A0AAN6G3B0_9PEZI|nr:hypothetical protein LTR35_015830 [Friedmanniomyces endolithicus]KAK0275762.1 hypothetical protein LTS00_014909 [Friedmanniomyces endolithicus]KAK0327822.1 hypothetical protein LTR82_001339 [Friedmanniomyces endolithicus]KAK0918640.1 hypothetical protein LTR57_011594 [Friedmanniomyces endolithicus]KAK0979758.1 hypothetical protein LTR54_015526 [Friedmanniomyces endolithicus]
MASRTYAFFGVSMAALVGVLTSYVTFAPELQKQQLERQGIFQDEHTHEQQQKQEHVISDAILSDIREAEKKITGPSKKGAFWGLREAIWGGAKQQTTIAAVAAAPVPATAQEKPVGQERGDIKVQKPASELRTSG